MNIDCIDSSDEVTDIGDDQYNDYTESITRTWMGRDVEMTTEKTLQRQVIAQFFQQAHQQATEVEHIEVGSRNYGLLDLQDEEEDEFAFDFAFFKMFSLSPAIYFPGERQFDFADPQQCKGEAAICKNVFSRTARGVKNCAKKVGRGVKKCARKVAHFVQDHKKEILIGTAVAAVAVGAYFVAGAIVGAAAGTQAIEATPKRRDEEDDTLSCEPEDEPISSGPPFDSDFVAQAHPQAHPTDVSNNTSFLDRPVAAEAITPTIPIPQAASLPSPFQSAIANFMGTLQCGLEAIQSSDFKPLSFDSSFNSPLHYGTEKRANEIATALRPIQENHSSIFQSIASFSEKMGSALCNGLETIGRGVIDPQLLNADVPLNIFMKTAIEAQKTSSPQTAALQNSSQVMFPELQSAISSFIATVGNTFNTSSHQIASVGGFATHPISLMPRDSAPQASCRVQTEGIVRKDKCIGFINGMNSSYEEHRDHLNHIRQFTDGLSIEGTYNHSNGIYGAIDIAEIFTLNYNGIAPVTANLLIENWTQFHLENANNPDAKYLQIAHSMGTILTKDALQQVSQEIRDRVIVLAIAPAVIVPRGLCFKSIAFASENDLVHLGENLYTICSRAFNDEPEQQEMLHHLIENKKQLIILKPHPEAIGMDHNFQSPTFKEKLKEFIEEYLEIKISQK